jgi:membrane dipeptidase
MAKCTPFSLLKLAILLALSTQTGCRCILPDLCIHRVNPRYNPDRISGGDRPSSAAVDLHESLFVADLHADSLLFRRDLTERSSLAHVDFPRLREGNVGLQVLGVVTSEPHWGINWLFFTDLLLSPMARVRDQTERLKKFVEKDCQVSLLLDRSDLDGFLAQNYDKTNGFFTRKGGARGTAVMLAVEGVQMLDPDCINPGFMELHRMGVRMMGLSHKFDNAFAGSTQGKERLGPTVAGKALLELMFEYGVVLDLAHASDDTIDYVLEVNASRWRRPLLVSHTGLREHARFCRNLSERQAVEIAKTDGVIGIYYWKRGIGGDRDIDAVVHTMLYLQDLLQRKGIEDPWRHIGLGSDYDGFIAAPFATDKLNILTHKLQQKGVGKNEVRGVMGGNALRVIREWLR